jgi:hypothetical protein
MQIVSVMVMAEVVLLLLVMEVVLALLLALTLALVLPVAEVGAVTVVMTTWECAPSEHGRSRRWGRVARRPRWGTMARVIAAVVVATGMAMLTCALCRDNQSSYIRVR